MPTASESPTTRTGDGSWASATGTAMISAVTARTARRRAGMSYPFRHNRRPALATSSVVTAHGRGTKTPVREEIQALRAIAVMLVVLFHLWPGTVPGGFVGVDVFFAISGFLITGLLVREIDRRGTVSL